MADFFFNGKEPSTPGAILHFSEVLMRKGSKESI